DVREPAEWTVARFPGAMEIPLGQLSKRLSELDRKTDWVLTCQQGPRAQRALALMQAEGFASLRVLEGGLEAWLAPDPS
ncbi:MAG: rhodanese-like domain-containing protein, partial [Xanthomonadales bacterium]|nr:rhodanese-like domain-containing protein [Xanthomonadales bacterium]